MIFTGYSPVTGAGSCAYQHYHIVIQNNTFGTNEENNGKRVILGVLVSKPSQLQCDTLKLIELVEV